MESVTFKKLFTEEIPKRVVLCVEVKEQNTLNKFKIVDQEYQVADLQVSTGKQQQTKMIEVGRKIRVIFPEIDVANQTIIVTDKTKIYPLAAKSGK